MSHTHFTTTLSMSNGQVVPTVESRPSLVSNESTRVCNPETTTAEDRSGLFTPSDEDLEALRKCPTSSDEHKRAVAAVERATAELRRLKDRKTGYLPYREETTWN